MLTYEIIGIDKGPLLRRTTLELTINCMPTLFPNWYGRVGRIWFVVPRCVSHAVDQVASSPVGRCP